MIALAPITWRGAPVPVITMWSGEADLRKPRVLRERWGGDRLLIIDDGVDAPGVGRPLFTRLHHGRCRRVVQARLCQICAQPLGKACIAISHGRTHAGHPLIRDGYPMHDACAGRALTACPALQRGITDRSLRCWLVPTGQWARLWVKIGIATGKDADERVNDMVRGTDGQIVSGPDLVLLRHTPMRADDLMALAAMEDAGR
ncbi:hypothetical protein P7L78_22185 [Tistrella bauzanensis]|uniref:hypothetical protein n=1 Tax=Tistrella TaxID=171436 RepID=UPI0031F657C0